MTDDNKEKRKNTNSNFAAIGTSTGDTYQKTCRNCMERRKGECPGEESVCEFHRYAPTISMDRINNWPKCGDASAFRKKFFKK